MYVHVCHNELPLENDHRVKLLRSVVVSFSSRWLLFCPLVSPCVSASSRGVFLLSSPAALTAYYDRQSLTRLLSLRRLKVDPSHIAVQLCTDVCANIIASMGCLNYSKSGEQQSKGKPMQREHALLPLDALRRCHSTFLRIVHSCLL